MSQIIFQQMKSQTEQMIDDQEKMKSMSESIVKQDEIEKPISSIEEPSLKKQMQEMIQVRKLSKGKYLERVTPLYQLILEYHKNTLYISLYTRRQKNYFMLIQDEGKNQLKNGLLSLDIFEAFKYNPEICAVNHYQGILILEVKYFVGKRQKVQRNEVKMEETQLNQETKIRIEYSRKMRKYQQRKIKEDQQKMNMYEKQINQYFDQIQNFFIKINKHCSKSLLVDRTTPYAKNFTLQQQKIIVLKQIGQASYQQILLRFVIRKYPFTFSAQRLQKTPNFVVGVLIRSEQAKKQNSELSGNAVCYDHQFRIIHFGEKGEHRTKDTFYKKDTISTVKVTVEEEKVTFLLTYTRMLRYTTHSCPHPYCNNRCPTEEVKQEYEEVVKSDIISKGNLGDLVPFFQMNKSGNSLQWSVQ